jgi:hypothetical protein
MDHNPGIRQNIAFALFPGRKQQGGSRSSHPKTNGLDIGLHELHRIVNSEGRGNNPSGRVDKHLNIPFFVLCLQKQQLGNDDISYMIVNFRT